MFAESGQMLSHYRPMEKVGEGGMGADGSTNRLAVHTSDETAPANRIE